MNGFGFSVNRFFPASEGMTDTGFGDWSVLAAVDRSFLGSVKDTFGGLGFSPEGLEILIWTVAIASIAAGVVILLNHYVLRPEPKIPIGTLMGRDEVTQLLQSALDQRNKIEFTFSREEQVSRPLHCAIESIHGGNLILDAGDFIQAHKGWLGRPVLCYFRVSSRSAGGASQFYALESEVAGVNKRADGSTLITLPVPDRVKMQQKRIHLRLEPPMEYMLGVAVWPELMNEDGARELRLKRWGKPALARHAGATEMMRVANLSAGGMRIDLPRETLKETGYDFEIGQSYYILTELYDPDMKRKQRLWFVARVQNRFEDFMTKDLEVGLRFTEIGRIADPEAMEIAWDKVPNHGVDALGNWIQRRHLELYRTRGVA